MPEERNWPDGTVFTVGHSTLPIGQFVALLKAYGIVLLADIRTIPRSRHNPQFNAAELANSLSEAGIGYAPMPALGGLRHPREDSPNTGWRNGGFRGYADYMQGEPFRDALEELISAGRRRRVAIMCAEAVPWRCHRSLVADALKVRGVPAVEILSENNWRMHELTPFAKVDGTSITYPPAQTRSTGASQMPLFGEDAQSSAPSTDLLFFALQPDAAAAGAMADIAARLREQHGLEGRPQAPGRLHVTLHFMGAFPGVPRMIVDQACNALSAFREPPFDVCFDRVTSFRAKGRRPVVLVGGESLAPLHRFQDRLRSALVRAQLPEPQKVKFVPHVTLLRDEREVPGQAVGPVLWTAREFVLVRSLVGRGQHQVLARFPLDG